MKEMLERLNDEICSIFSDTISIEDCKAIHELVLKGDHLRDY